MCVCVLCVCVCVYVCVCVCACVQTLEGNGTLYTIRIKKGRHKCMEELETERKCSTNSLTCSQTLAWRKSSEAEWEGFMAYVH